MRVTERDGDHQPTTNNNKPHTKQFTMQQIVNSKVSTESDVHRETAVVEGKKNCAAFN